MAMYLQENVCATTLLIMLEAQRSVALDSGAINHAFRCMMAKGVKCEIQYQMKSTKHIRDLNLYHA